MKDYIGPDPLFIRAIDTPFAADPDIADPSVAATAAALTAITDVICWSTPNVRRGTMAPLTKVIVSFVCLNSAGAQLIGTATADIYAFYVNEPAAYNMRAGARPVVRKTGVVTGYDLHTDLVVDVTKHKRTGLRLSNIVVPVGTTTLRLAVQELS